MTHSHKGITVLSCSYIQNLNWIFSGACGVTEHLDGEGIVIVSGVVIHDIALLATRNIEIDIGLSVRRDNSFFNTRDLVVSKLNAFSRGGLLVSKHRMIGHTRGTLSNCVGAHVEVVGVRSLCILYHKVTCSVLHVS